MDFKALNEQLKTLLETGFAVSGQKDEVNDILAKLDQEYGDLTIPEFIDLMIKKEEKGENVLDESLNEGYRFKNTDIAYINYSMSQYCDINKINTNYNNLDIKIGPAEYHDARIDITNKYNKEKAVLFLTIVFEQKSDNVNEWLGYFALDVRDKSNGSQQIERFLMENTERLGGIEYNSSTSYDCLFGKTLSRRRPESNKEAIEDLIQNFNNLLQKLDGFLRNNSSKYDTELEELEKARREARANKNAANTTVKQALSKSGIAKKIRELQNPTPEQLARILAAIEG